jgi:hypothetical protein
LSALPVTHALAENQQAITMPKATFDCTVGSNQSQKAEMFFQQVDGDVFIVFKAITVEGMPKSALRFRLKNMNMVPTVPTASTDGQKRSLFGASFDPYLSDKIRFSFQSLFVGVAGGTFTSAIPTVEFSGRKVAMGCALRRTKDVGQ